MADGRRDREAGRALTPRRRTGASREGAPASGFRQRRRAAERSRRRRVRRRRAVVVVTLVLLVVASYLAVSRIGFGGGGSGDPGGPDGTTVSTEPGTAETVLVAVRAGGETKVAVVLAPLTDPTVLVALPGDTLVRAPAGYERLRVLLDAEGDTDDAHAQAAEALEEVVGVAPAAFASVEWAAVVEAVAEVDGGPELPADLAADEKVSADAVAAAFARLAEMTGEETTDRAVRRLRIEGGQDQVRAALDALADGAVVAGGIPGRVVEGLGYAYFEPDPAALRAMLGGSPPESAVSVEVQNGSGLVGAAQKVSDLIAPLGYTILPPRNAEGFPDVETTQVFAAPDAVGEADRLRNVVGSGVVVQQDSLPPGRVVIVVGKDFDPDTPPGGSD